MGNNFSKLPKILVHMTNRDMENEHARFHFQGQHLNDNRIAYRALLEWDLIRDVDPNHARRVEEARAQGEPIPLVVERPRNNNRN